MFWMFPDTGFVVTVDVEPVDYKITYAVYTVLS